MPVHRKIAKMVKKVLGKEDKKSTARKPVGGSWSGSRKEPAKVTHEVPTAKPAPTQKSWSGSRKPPGKGPPARSGLTNGSSRRKKE